MRTAAGLALAFALAAAGCATTMKEVVASKEKGASEVYPVAPDRARVLAEDVLYEVTREPPEDHWDRGFVCVRGGLVSDETLIAVWVEPREKAGESLVTVVVRRASGMQIAVVLTEEEFHARFRRAAGLRPKE